MNSGNQFSNAIKQLEDSRGKPRETWDIDDWKSAAESLERTVSALGKLFVNAVEVAQSLSKPETHKKTGRPRKSPGLWMVKAKPKPLSSRHLNFGNNTKWTPEKQWFLLAITEAMKIKHGLTTDIEALKEVAKIIPKNKSLRTSRKESIGESMKSALSRARKKHSSQTDKEIIEKMARQFANQLSDK